MRNRRRLTLAKIQRRNPGVSFSLIALTGSGFGASARRGVERIAYARGKTPEEAWYCLGERLLRVAAREAFARAGWRDQNTGRIEPLSAHHLTKRSKGRDDSSENLSAVGVDSHAAQHEGRS